ncbi:hypothetical protein F2Q70_00044171 [Brassica cretica]|uniref:Retrotransposon gag domain-containing protein n=1 Tax=Brassica cretica TaxID=69181 RepID=A0A8S9KGG6_BRACR|nr:hypothetical protein F2Q70_00044171 [Brassica cretica]
MESSADLNTTDGCQNILMLRHGDRIDKINPLWPDTASRPWDPPLVQDGLVRAFQTGQRIRSQIQFPIHRVFVSPFIRCVQTASEVIAALSAVDLNPNATSSKDVLSIDKSKLKVSIEFGLSEMLNSMAIRPKVAPKDGKFDFKISDLESMFPEGMVDHDVDPVYKEIHLLGLGISRYIHMSTRSNKGIWLLLVEPLDLERMIHKSKRAVDTLQAAIGSVEIQASIDTIHPASVDENEMLRDEEGRTLNNAGQLINAQGQDPFQGLPHQDPRNHLEELEDLVPRSEQNEVSEYHMLCNIFPYSISGNAFSWFSQLQPGSLTSWDDIENAFLYKFLDDAEATREKEKNDI